MSNTAFEMSKKDKQLMLDIVTAKLSGKEVPDITQADSINNIVRMAKVHGLGHILNLAIGGRCDSEVVNNQLSECSKRSRVMEAKQTFECEKIVAEFEKNNIPCVLLKGTVIRECYPSPEMRYMSDIDILIKEEDKNKIKEIMTKAGFGYRGERDKDIDYIKPPFVHFEFHKTLVEDIVPSYQYHLSAWDRVEKLDNHNSTYRLHNEDFYVFMIEHIVKHFVYGGITARSVIDIEFYLKKYRDVLNWDYIYSELNKNKLSKFEKNLQRLARVWFDNEPSDEILDQMTETILENYMEKESLDSSLSIIALNDIGIEKSGKFKALVDRIFPSYNKMKFWYPSLQKMPFLLPLMWFVRIISSPFRHGNVLKREMSFYNKMDEADKIKEYYNKFGIE